MTDLETQLYETLHAVADTGRSLSGPALRRRARTRQLTIRGGSVVALGAAGTAAALVVPGLLSSPAGTGARAGGAASANASAAPLAKALAAAPTAGVVAKPAPSGLPVSAKAIPVEAYLWAPAGDLIDDPTVLAVAPEVASRDADWTAWSDGKPLLDKDTVSVAFADASILEPTAQYPHPLVIVTGRTSADSPTLEIAALTTIEAGSARTDVHHLTVQATTTVAPNGAKVIAVTNGTTLYVVAEAGVDSATYSWTDNTGQHTAAMTVTNGVAVAASPMAGLKADPHGQITNIRAVSHGKVVWDAEPVKGR